MVYPYLRVNNYVTHVVGIIPSKHVAGVVRDGKFSGQLINSDTQIVFMDEWSSDSLSAEDAKRILQGIFNISKLPWLFHWCWQRLCLCLSFRGHVLSLMFVTLCLVFALGYGMITVENSQIVYEKGCQNDFFLAFLLNYNNVSVHFPTEWRYSSITCVCNISITGQPLFVRYGAKRGQRRGVLVVSRTLVNGFCLLW